ncbi:MAG: hypothetical protein GY852_01085 [bacterium]|nr:hypothetical protein [bacterium]
MAETMRKGPMFDESKLPREARRNRVHRIVRRGFKRNGRPAPQILQVFGWEARGAKQFNSFFSGRSEHFKGDVRAPVSRLWCLGEIMDLAPIKKSPVVIEGAEERTLKKLNAWAENQMDLRRMKALIRGNATPTMDELVSVHLALGKEKNFEVQQCLFVILLNAIKTGKEGVSEAADACLDNLLDFGLTDFRA